MTMTFDLSRPYRRVERNKHIYWKLEEYDPEDPESNTNGKMTAVVTSARPSRFFAAALIT